MLWFGNNRGLTCFINEYTNINATVDSHMKKEFINKMKEKHKGLAFDKIYRFYFDGFIKKITKLDYNEQDEKTKEAILTYYLYKCATKGGFLKFFDYVSSKLEISGDDIEQFFDNFTIDLKNSAISAYRIWKQSRTEVNFQDLFTAHDSILESKKKDLEKSLEKFMKDNFTRLNLI